MQTFNITIDEKTSNYLERLTYETGYMKDIIDHIFISHKNDADASLFDSVPWKTYMKKYQEAFAEFDMAKEKLTEELMPIVKEKLNKEIVSFTWRIVNFNDNLIEIQVVED